MSCREGLQAYRGRSLPYPIGPADFGIQGLDQFILSDVCGVTLCVSLCRSQSDRPTGSSHCIQVGFPGCEGSRPASEVLGLPDAFWRTLPFSVTQ